MTAITNLYNTIYTIVSTTLTSRLELYNPYDLENNSDLTLKKGYGIAFQESTYNQELYNVQRDTSRNIVISLTERVDDHRASSSVRRVVEKNLFEDRYSIISALINNFEIHKYGEELDLVGDNGIEFVRAEGKNYLALRITFSLKYSENF